MQRALSLLVALVLAVLVAGVAQAAVGDPVSDQDFDLAASNADPAGTTWDGTYFRVVDSGDDKVYTYNSSGTYISSQDFNLTSASDDARGITWDGTYFRVVDSGDDKVYTYNSSGTYISSQDFNLTSASTAAIGITWDGTYLRVADFGDDKVYTYNSAGTYISSQDFNLTSANAYGMTWDGTYFRVADITDDKVYTYNSAGTYISSQDFNLTSANGQPDGITWDGTYLRVVDHGDNKVYAYEGLPVGPFTNHGIPGDTEYAALFAATVSTRGDWLCAQSTSGETYRVNNAQLTVHGFCAKEEGNGISVEIHLAPDTSYASLSRFADVTGPWWFVESGAAAQLGQRIYDDTPKDTDDLAFTEEVGGLEDSTRLGFSTVAKLVTDDDCAEDTDHTGFVCTVTNLVNLAAGDTAVLGFGLSDKNNIEFADPPRTPESITVSRSSDYTESTLAWTLYDAVSEYEVERVVAVQVDVADSTRIEYGDPITYMVGGTQAGISEYADDTLQADRTYQFRIRARGAEAASWSAWSDYIFSGAEPEADIGAPANLELMRDDDSVTASWNAPAGELDGYTLQRQELLLVGGSTFFANIVSLGDDMWLPSTSTMYVDSSIVPDQTYEYRVGAVLADRVGEYTDWFRVGPANLSLGEAPQDLQLLESGQRILDERYEFWMGWDEVGRADDYEIQLVSYDLETGGRTSSDYVVTDPTFFHTSFGRVSLRVRAREQDSTACAGLDDDRCLSQWTAWYDVRFTPIITIPAPPMVDASADASIMEFRDSFQAALRAAIEPVGTTIDAVQVTNFMVLTLGVLLGSVGVWRSWKRGMAALGVGMGAGVMILTFFVGYRLLGSSVAWAIAAQTLVVLLGFIAIERQFGFMRSGSRSMMMLKILIGLVVIHLALGFTQMSLSYFAGDVAEYGAAGWVSHTPIGTFIDLEETPQDAAVNFTALDRIFDTVNKLGDSINGLLTLGYDFLTMIDSSDGLVYMLVIGIRAVSTLVWFALAMAGLYTLFDSNLLTSKLGLGLIAFGGGLTALAGAGALLD